ncbi:MAG: hypothetical protein KDJ52_26475 [Anaerolineae bacterium]|nr:hypothetical protein [Anaerolineae bacterium]
MNDRVRYVFVALKRSLRLMASGLAGMVMMAYACWGAVNPLSVFAATTIIATEIRDELQQDGDCSLREAVQSVNTGTQFDKCGPGAHGNTLPAGPYTISLLANDYTLSITGTGEDANSTGDLDLNVSVTIEGVSAALTSINGGAIDRIFDIDPTDSANITVTLVDVTVENGLAPGMTDGGGIRNQGDTLYVQNSNIDDNRIGGGAFGSGGGIANVGGILHIVDSRISNNRLVDGSGGGVYNFLGGTATISNSIISGNRASVASGFASGGGISNSSSRMDIVNTTIIDNEADGFGGGLINFSSTSTMNIANSTVTGNRADSSGGGIRNSGALSMTHVTIIGNIADFNGDDSGDGGGIRSQFGGTVLKGVIVFDNEDNSSPSGNVAPDGYGDFISAGYNIIGDVTQMTGFTDGVNNDRIGIDPLLDPLTGSPGYFPLQQSSPAIDFIPAADCTFISSGSPLLIINGDPVMTAQNTVSRPSNDGCEIGAYEGPHFALLPVILR